MENRGVWKWMEKELRTTKNRRVGMGSSWGRPLPETPRMHGFLCLPIHPTQSDEGTSGTYLCVRQGLRALRLTHQVTFWGGGAVPFFSKGLFSVQYSLWVFVIELVCGLLPAQQSFLGFSNSPEVCPVKPHGPSCRGIPPAALPQVRKEPDVWSHCPSSPAPSQGQLCASQLWAETIPITGLCLWVLSLLFLIFKKERQHG